MSKTINKSLQKKIVSNTVKKENYEKSCYKPYQITKPKENVKNCVKC